MISFDDTAIAFEAKTNSELKKAKFLFSLIGNQRLMKIGRFLTLWAFKFNLPLKKLVKATIFKQFCGGETLEECLPTMQHLGKYNIGSIPDYSVEGKENTQDIIKTTNEILFNIQKSKTLEDVPFCVFKMSGITSTNLLEKLSAKAALSSKEEEDYIKLKERVRRICDNARMADKPIFIDAEETWLQEAIDKIALDMMKIFNTEKVLVYTTIQMYRKDKLEYLKKMTEIAKNGNFIFGVKLVRGAYLEKENERAKKMGYPSPMQSTKQDTDNDYDQALEFCVNHIDNVALVFGSHNEKSAALLTSLMQKSNIENNHPHIYFSQLFGMSDHISFKLAKEGFNVAKYLPYGPVKEVLPYLIRRAEENTSVAGQTNRELSLLTREIKRRS
jgi:proline dehydrogenase